MKSPSIVTGAILVGLSILLAPEVSARGRAPVGRTNRAAAKSNLTAGQRGLLNAVGRRNAGASSAAREKLTARFGKLNFLPKDLDERATFSPSDSSRSGAAHLGTIDHPESTLTGLRDDELHWLVMAARDTVHFYPETSYIEAQIHGPVRFNEDVEALVVDANLRDTPDGQKLRALAVKNSWKLKWLKEESGRKWLTEEQVSRNAGVR